MRIGGNISQPLTVNYQVGGSAVGSQDYHPLTGTVIFAAGATTATITVTTIDDFIYEGNETVVVTLVPNPTVYHVLTLAGMDTCVIADDERAVSVATIENASEDGGIGVLRFTRTGDLTQGLTITCTVGGTASPSTNYVPLSGSVAIASGQASADVQVTAIDNAIPELDRFIQVDLLPVTGHTIEHGTTTLAIEDNDRTPGLVEDDVAIYLGSPLTIPVRSNDSGAGNISSYSSRGAQMLQLAPLLVMMISILFVSSCAPGGGSAPAGDPGPHEFSPKPVRTLDAHKDPVEYLEFSPDSKWLGSTCLGSMGIVWNAATGKEIFRRAHKEQSYDIRFHPNNGTVFIACYDGNVRVWEFDKPDQKEPKRTYSEPFGDRGVCAMVLDASGKKMLTTVNSYHGVVLWDLKNGTTKLIVPDPAIQKTLHPDSIAFAPSAERFIVAHTANAFIWDLKQDKVVGTLTIPKVFLRAIYSPDGKWIATSELGGIVRVWDALTFKEVGKTVRHRDQIHGVQFTPDSKYLISCCMGVDDFTGELRIWDVAAKKDLGLFRPHKSGCKGMAISPDGKRLATSAFDGEIKIWDLAAILRELTARI